MDQNLNKPNIIFIFADQMRVQSTGYTGDPNVKTPNLDTLAEESINFTTAVSNCPVCTPYRACLLTGQYPLTHGLFMNDLHLKDNAVTWAKIYKKAGYDTAYIGKWHLDGRGRGNYIPPESRQGFDYWKVLECTHDYNHSLYYQGDDTSKHFWDGYDAFAQTDDAVTYIKNRRKTALTRFTDKTTEINAAERQDPGPNSIKPFVLFLSYGPPHNPYDTAPQDYLDLYDPTKFQIAPNVHEKLYADAREELHGYYAHISALDTCVGKINQALHDQSLAENTIFIFTSDHGDSIESQCTPEFPGINKQRPYDESVLVPFLLRWPLALRGKNRQITMPIATPDILPTMLGLCGISIPPSVEGIDYSQVINGKSTWAREAVLIASYSPFADWRHERGGREYRGIRTERYTYVKDLHGPWFLFDNQEDPYQMNNLIHNPDYASLREHLGKLLQRELKAQGDDFLSGKELRNKWGYVVNPKNMSIPF